jgi:hypothetical protein
MSRHNRDRRERRRLEQQYVAQKYVQAVLAQHEAARARGDILPGRAYSVEVRHDHWCALLAGRGPCNCNPDVLPPSLLPSPKDN